MTFVGIFMLKLFWDMFKMAWDRFVEDDEKAFNILRDKNVK